MNRRRFIGTLGAGLGIVRVGRVPAARLRDHFVERWSWAMGQPVHVMVFAASEPEGLDACAAALAELRRVEGRLSLFDDASDLCELNRHAGRAPMRVDADLRAVLRLARAFRHASGGAFDVAVEPLMRVWGFHRPRASEPAPPEIAEAREAVATAVVQLAGDTARLPQRHTQLDLGGIGVGYGIDRALAVLAARGILRAFVDVSGDCGALGTPPGEPGWRVEIADATGAGRPVAATRLCDAALATSANTLSVIRFGKSVRGHVMNPATGWPAHALVQATVVARTAVAADALSTGMLVSGKEPPGAIHVYCVVPPSALTLARAAPGRAPAPARGRAPAGPPSKSRSTAPDR